MEITTVYQKERKDFGRSVIHLSKSNIDIVDEFLGMAELTKEFIERSPTILDIQAIPDMSESYVNTETVTYRAQGMCHLEGGWPKDVDPTEKDQTTCVLRPSLRGQWARARRGRGCRPLRRCCVGGALRTARPLLAVAAAASGGVRVCALS